MVSISNIHGQQYDTYMGSKIAADFLGKKRLYFAADGNELNAIIEALEPKKVESFAELMRKAVDSLPPSTNASYSLRRYVLSHMMLSNHGVRMHYADSGTV